MECLKMLLCCAASLAAIATRGQAAPQFSPYAFQNKRSLDAPDARLNGLAPAFNDFGTPFDFSGFPAAAFDDAAASGLPQLPATADFAGFTGFPSAGFPSTDFGSGFPQNQPQVADGFAALGLAGYPSLPADFARSITGPLQVPAQPPQQPSSEPSRLQSGRHNSTAAEHTTYASNTKAPTAASPAVSELVLDLAPPPYTPPYPPNPSAQTGAENPSPAADDFDSVPIAALLPGRPFDYGKRPVSGRVVAAANDRPSSDASASPPTYAMPVVAAPFAGNGAVPSAAANGRMPVVVVYGGSNAHSASSYDDANAVRNSFDEIAGILTDIVKTVPGELVGEPSGSISANSKRESSSGVVRSLSFRYPVVGGEYKRD